MIDRPFQLLPPSELPRIWLGANFWSRAGGPFMWRTFQPDTVRQELQVLRDHGLNCTRSFLFWPDFMPAPDTLDEAMVERYGQFLDLCQQVGIATIPTFIVGHMSGENWDVPWRQGRDLYTDGFMLAQQAWFIQSVVHRFHRHPGIAGWLISNEMPLYGGEPAAEYGRSWALLMVQAVRAGGGSQPVSLGEGAWGIETSGRDNGFRLREIAPFVNWIGPHIYPSSNDLYRQHLSPAFLCEMSHVGKPVILEEFGLTTDFASAQHAAQYYQQVLNTTLLAGTVGWVAWNNTDFALTGQDPYRHHPFELHFGITTAGGEPKTPLLEMQRFGRLLEVLDLPACARPPSDVGLVVSSFLDTLYPFSAEEERVTLRDILLQAYVVTWEAHLQAAPVRSSAGIPAAKLLLLPSTKQLTGPEWETLENHARNGSVVYVSYFSGSVGYHRGPWHPNVNAFFGIEHQLRYGLVNPVTVPIVTWTFERPFGGLPVGATLQFTAAGNENGRAFLPLTVTEAEVVARDAQGNPALIERKVGSGAIILSTYPIEYFAAARPAANPEDSWRLYAALANRAGVELPVRLDRPDVLCGTLQRRDGATFVWLISEAENEVQVTPEIAGTLVDAITGEAVSGPISLPPFGVRVFRLQP